MSDSGLVSTLFIRECYIIWFGQFLPAAQKWPTGKFALSSSPGCGKTMVTNYLFKMAHSHPILQNKPILYQSGKAFFYFNLDKVFYIDRNAALKLAINNQTFYILDGLDAKPVHSECLTLFIASPRSNHFKDWHYHAQITPSYFPVWSLNELRDCRALCYPEFDVATVDRGGIARYVFWPNEEPPSLEGVIADSNARKSFRSAGDPSQLFPSSHMMLHISVDENLHFQHIVLASRHVGYLLFDKYFDETLERLKSLLGGRSALAGHLFECYAHFLLEHGHPHPFNCRSLEGVYLGSLPAVMDEY